MKTAIKVNPSKPDSVQRQSLRLMTINGFAPNEYNPHRVKCWLVRNEHTSCLAVGSSEQEAIDNCVDSHLWDSLLMSEDIFQEYDANGFDDSYVLAGNASEPFWFEHVLIQEIIL